MSKDHRGRPKKREEMIPCPFCDGKGTRPEIDEHRQVVMTELELKLIWKNIKNLEMLYYELLNNKRRPPYNITTTEETDR